MTLLYCFGEVEHLELEGRGRDGKVYVRIEDRLCTDAVVEYH